MRPKNTELSRTLLAPRGHSHASRGNGATGPVNDKRLQRTAEAMPEFGMLSQQYTSEVEQGTLVKSMVGP
jgi:hypothetical protein